MGNGRVHRELCPIVLLEDSNGLLAPSVAGVLLKHNEIEDIIKRLNEYKNAYDDSDIDRYNEEFRRMMYEGLENPTPKTTHNKNVSGYVYLLSCSDKYKVGYSNNVERRMKQLDTRPFPLKLVCKTYSDIAFDVEQRIHKIMSDHKVEGEWYDFDFDVKADEFSDFVLKVERKILLERGQI